MGRSRAALIGFAVTMVAAATAWADYQMGEEAFENRDYKGALAELQPLAEQGDARSQYLLGTMYRQGLLGVPDKEKGRQWLTMAADGGNADAQFSLGLMYFQGEIRPPKDAKKTDPLAAAFDLFQRAAEQGHSDAQLYLGQMYENGMGIRRDRVEALKWYQLAVWQRNSIANAAHVAIQAAMSPEAIAEGKARARDWKPEESGQTEKTRGRK
jgi:TPR repeat protein